MDTTQTTASRLAAGFAVRTVDDTKKTFIIQEGPDAETLEAMVFQADNNGLGWDFAYEAVHAAIDYLDDCDSSPFNDDVAHDFADAECDPYTANPTAWLASSLKHAAICDDAAEEIEDRTRWGQHRAYEIAMQAVADHWPQAEKADDQDA